MNIYNFYYDFYFDEMYEYMTEGYFEMETYDDWHWIDLQEEGVSMWRDWTLPCYDSGFFHDGSYELWINGEWEIDGGESDDFLNGYDCISYDYCNADACFKITYHPWEDEFYTDLSGMFAEDPEFEGQLFKEFEWWWIDEANQYIEFDLYFDPVVHGLDAIWFGV